MVKQLAQSKERALYIISDHSIIVYEYHQLPPTAKWLKFRRIGTHGEIDIMLSGKSAKREGTICNVIMNKIQSMKLSTKGIRLTW